MINRLSLFLVLLAALLPEKVPAADGSPGTRVREVGIAGMAPDPVVRRETPDSPTGESWLYQVGLPFQVSGTQAAIFCRKGSRNKS